MRLIDVDALIEDLKYDVELDNRLLDDTDYVGLDRTLTQLDKDCKQNVIELLKNTPSAQPEPCEDAVSRKAVIRLLHSDYHNKSMIEEVKELPSAQPEIIVCADCKHWICHDRRCGYWNHGVKPLEWCCHAERRIDG